MSVATVHSAICDTLDSVDWFVDRNRGRISQFPWESNILKPLWAVNFARSRLLKRTNLTQTFERTFEINGFFPFNYDAESDVKWLSYIDALEVLLSPQPAIAVCTMTFPPSFMVNDHVECNSVVCQHTRAEFVVWEVLNG